MSEEDDYSLYERAIYASLSGNLDHILPVCEGWSDALWAHLKVCEGDMIMYHTQNHTNSQTCAPLSLTNCQIVFGIRFMCHVCLVMRVHIS